MRVRGLAVLSAAAFILAGCSGDETPEPEDTATSPTDEETEPTDDDTAPDDAELDDDSSADLEDPAAEDAGDENADDDTSAPNEPLASSETTLGGAGGGPVRLDVVDVLRRGEDIMEVRLALTTFDEAVNPFSQFSADTTDDLSGLTVEDIEAGERLLVLRDSAGACVCSETDRIPSDTTRELFARFPAPVSDVIDLAIPNFATFNDLPVR